MSPIIPTLTKTFTADNIKPIKMNVSGTFKMMDKLKEQMFQIFNITFQGIPVKVDKELIGNQYEIHVSPELYAKLELMKNEKMIVKE